MDIFKLLSRSTKQKNKAATTRDIKPAKLPSAGTSANPQLYHDVVESRGKKRKRGTEQAVEESHEAEESIDFFAPKDPIPKKDKVQSEKYTTSADAVKLLDTEECRQILRSHRLKVTLLSSGRSEKKIKKSKKLKLAKKPVKNEQKQLYPQPLQTLSELRTGYQLSHRMAENLVDQGYKLPTEVQMGSLPLLLRPERALGEDAELGEQDVDLLAVAPTGSGKTLAFLIPIVNQIIQRRRKNEDKSLHLLEAVVMAPTKELASQIVNEAKKLSLGTGVKVVGMKKGMRVIGDDTEGEEAESGADEDEEDEVPVKKGAQPRTKVDILVATPGLLLSSISIGEDTHTPLPNVKTLVLDEADVLLDPLFRDQTLGIWNACTNASLRVTLWSATMGSNIEALATATINSRCTTLSISPRPLIRLIVGLKDSALPTITHTLIYTATEPGKLLALRQLLHPTGTHTTSLRPPFLVFTQTIPRAIALHSELLYDIPPEAGGSSRLAVLHSELSDSVRSSVMSRFRNGEIWVLITTDILSRGVDFRGVNGVVNYDVPNSGAAYIHRVGRTGRAGREGGVAVTFYTKEDVPYVKGIANIIAASEKAAGKEPGEASMQRWLLDALPKTSKDEKRKLKLHGVEARRGGLKKEDGKGVGKGKMRIGTKSGYERKLENRKKGAIEGSKRRSGLEIERRAGGESGEASGEDSEWGGLD